MARSWWRISSWLMVGGSWEKIKGSEEKSSDSLLVTCKSRKRKKYLKSEKYFKLEEGSL